VYWSIKRFPQAQNVWLVLVSYYLYAENDVQLLVIVLAVTLMNYLSGLLMTENRSERLRKSVLQLSIIGNVSVLAIFVYYNFFISQFSALLASFGLSINGVTLALLIPVGLTYMTFQAISYNIDVFRGTCPPTNNLVAFALYLVFFPKVVAGPIERPAKLLHSLLTPKSLSWQQLLQSIHLLVVGSFKKMVCANLISQQIAPLYTNPSSFNTLDTILMMCLYSFQIYADFS
jgi:D-alanyl-lipoteichoic acid acyltransferase DltB (MBOAT superfamily)